MKKNRKTFYITTPLYYVNGKPHIGSAYTTIVADILARYKRKAGYDVFYLTGTDEHGLKIYETAKKKGIENIKDFVDEVASEFKDVWDKLDIKYDYFIRTTDEKHVKAVKKFWNELYKKGDIYKGKYKGWYCISCETYFTEKELVGDNKCPDCGKDVEWVEEENYFFKLSRYQDDLIELYEKNSDFVLPEFRKNEMLYRLKNDKLEDLSISRKKETLPWGISLPFDEDHVLYVWVDALLNYITSLGYGEDSELFEKYWPADVHFIGKEINWFHSVIWPAMLIAAGIEPPKSVFAHGWLTVNGGKISKSKGNTVDPIAISDKYSLDIMKYYLLRDIKFGRDGDFSYEKLENRVNSDLANDLGNLLNRTLQMIIQYCDGEIPSSGNNLNKYDNDLISMTNNLYSKVDEHVNNYNFTDALSTIWTFIRRTNKYIDQTEPWILGRENKEKRLGTVLYNLSEAIRIIAVIISPFMENTSKKILTQLGLNSKKELEKGFDALEWGLINSKTKVNKKEVIFPRIEKSKKKGKNMEKNKKTTSVKKDNKSDDNLVDIKEFGKIDLTAGKILNVEDIEKADKLYKIKVDIGSEKRQIVAGIKKYYSKEELIGKNIVIVSNLKPAKLMGVKSEGMLLAAKSENNLTLVTYTDKDSKFLGSKIQ